MRYQINQDLIRKFGEVLQWEEKSKGTIEKYIRDVQGFWNYIGEQAVTKEKVIAYKRYLKEQYEITTANSILSSINGFLKKMGWHDFMVKFFKIQREAFRAEARELNKFEYYQLIQEAEKKKNMRLSLLMQTICSTGIRVSELPFITVESLYTRRAKVSLKGKVRTVILPLALCRKLIKYVKEKGIQKGSVFITRSGKAIHRSNVFREMKSLCKGVDIDSKKVFPHNLRHLFACVYYAEEKDISHLADILGHTSVNTTRIYLTKSSEEQALQIEKMGLVT